ncbi:ribonuclease T2-like protein [Absidia repens]|uniref:Ribonuclease T2-like protein n=1 Tax=Absidia repens TaxID=90262 RepID=A0A1X2I1W0_9FUNG|nr:ribonuclease T2-like protein [Absidia repens]
MMKISLGAISSLAILSVVNALTTSLITRQVETCPIDALSCTPDAGGSCCSPSNGIVVLTQRWNQGLGPADSFTVKWFMVHVLLRWIPHVFPNYTQYHDVYTYFGTALQLRKQYDLFSILSDANITPGGSYSLDEFEYAIRSYTGFTPRITCKRGSVLEDIRIYFNVRNRDQYEPRNSTIRSNCSRQGRIHFPVK